MIGFYHKVVEAFEANELMFSETISLDDEKILNSYFKDYHNQAVCFDMGVVEGWFDFKIHSELVKLPYPVCWFESNSSKSGKCFGCLCWIENDRGFEEIISLVCLKQPGQTWMIVGIVSNYFENNKIKTVAMPETSDVVQVLDGCSFIALAFLSALNCKNVVSIETKPPQKLQIKRKKGGRIPLFSYWTLHLNLEKTSGHSLSNSSDIKNSLRLHLRRGHIRQYKPGYWTWVNACVVGNNKTGIIQKDYSVKYDFKIE
jgi:hypothetical protein